MLRLGDNCVTEIVGQAVRQWGVRITDNRSAIAGPHDEELIIADQGEDRSPKSRRGNGPKNGEATNDTGIVYGVAYVAGIRNAAEVELHPCTVIRFDSATKRSQKLLASRQGSVIIGHSEDFKAHLVRPTEGFYDTALNEAGAV